MSDELLLKFRDKDTSYGVTRGMLKALAAELDTTETIIVHLAPPRFAKEILPAYAADEAPLSSPYLAWLKGVARAPLPKGRIIQRKSLF